MRSEPDAASGAARPRADIADRRDALERFIQPECEVLTEFDSGAGEATFSVALAH